MSAPSRAAIDHFLSSRRIAFIGLSHNPEDFSRHLFREFVSRGYDVVPVNPQLAEAEGRPCYSSVRNIVPPVDGAVVMTSAEKSEDIVRECADAGINRVWLYRALGQGAVSDAAIQACTELGVEVVAGECPFMFLSESEFPHNVHAWVKKLTFTFPR
jgi:predicted CoA-binding protein